MVANARFSATSLTPGPNCRGRIATAPEPGDEGYVLLVRRPAVDHFHALSRCRAVLCEEGGVNNHPAVLCRIWGKPMLALEGATRLFRDGEVVTLVPGWGEVYRGEVALPDPNEDDSRHLAALARQRGVRFQLSVVDEGDICRANRLGEAVRVSQFFLREELLWVKHDLEPFAELRRYGAGRIAEFLAGHVRRCLRELRPGQTLNFRSLDMRSDETPRPGSLGVEDNPQMGNHGIRRTLREGGPFVAVELQALALLSDAERERILFSLPFVSEEEEVREVARLMRRHCPRPVRLGVFVETPAAVTELPAILDNQDVAAVHIGTKDLTQTVLACDRGNAAVRYLYSPRKRPVLAAIRSALTDCLTRRTPAVLFASREELEFFLDELPWPTTISMCCGEFVHLFADPSTEEPGARHGLAG